MTTFVALALNVIGFLSMAAANPRYRGTLLGSMRLPVAQRILRLVAFLLIAMSWFVVSLSAGPALASITTAGLSMVGAMVTVACVTVCRKLRAT